MFAFATLGLIIYVTQDIARMPSVLIGAAVGTRINLATLPTEYFLLIKQWKSEICIIRWLDEPERAKKC